MPSSETLIGAVVVSDDFRVVCEIEDVAKTGESASDVVFVSTFVISVGIVVCELVVVIEDDSAVFLVNSLVVVVCGTSVEDNSEIDAVSVDNTFVDACESVDVVNLFTFAVDKLGIVVDAIISDTDCVIGVVNGIFWVESVDDEGVAEYVATVLSSVVVSTLFDDDISFLSVVVS